MSEQAAASAPVTEAAAPVQASEPAQGASPADISTPKGATEQVTKAEAKAISDVLNLEEYGNKLVTVKVDGEERTLPLKDALRDAIRGKTAVQRFEEAKKLRAKADQDVAVANRVIDAIRDPRSRRHVLRQLGVDERQLVEEYIAEQEHLAKMSPAQIEMMRVEEERRKVQEERKQFETAREKAERERIEQQTDAEAKRYQSQISNDFNSVLKESGIDAKTSPDLHKQFFRAMIGEARAMAEAGEVFNARHCFEDARSKIIAQMQYLAKVDPSEAERIFGDDFGALEKNVREYSLKKLGAAKQQPVVEHRRAPAKANEPRRKLSTDELRDILAKKA